jgi:hypothetical protein
MRCMICRIAFDRARLLVDDCKFDGAIRFSEGRAVVTVGQLKGYVDLDGMIVIPPTWQFAFSFSEGVAPVRMTNLTGFIDLQGRTAVPCDFTSRTVFGSALAWSRRKRKSATSITRGTSFGPGLSLKLAGTGRGPRVVVSCRVGLILSRGVGCR